MAERVCSLREYLINYSRVSESQLGCVEPCRDRAETVGTDTYGLQRVLDRTLVLYDTSKPHKRVAIDDDWTYDDLFNACICYILRTDSRNVLVKGLNSAAAGNVFGTATNFAINTLKSTPWRVLWSRVGSETLAYLVLNCCLFAAGAPHTPLVQLSGPELRHNYRVQHSKLPKTEFTCPAISRRVFMYNRSRSGPKIGLLGISADSAVPKEVLATIFPFEFRHCNSVPNSTPSRVPKRLRPILPMAEALLENHQNFNYLRKLRVTCPAVDRPVFGGMTYDYATPVAQIVEFCVQTIDSVIPYSFIGTKYNKSILSRHIAAFLTGNYTQSVPVADLVRELRPTEMPWLSRGDLKWSQSEFQAKRQLLIQFIYWLFHQFVSRLVAKHFYATECSDNPGSLLFFRKDVWFRITRQFLHSYIARTLKEQPAAFGPRPGGFRVVPKPNGFRFISRPCLSRIHHVPQETVTWLLQACRLVLQHERNAARRSGKWLGCPVVRSAGEVARELLRLKSRLIAHHGTLPPLFIAKFDMQDCYDSMDTEKVAELLQTAFSSFEYHLRGAVSVARSRARFKFQVFERPPFGFDELLKGKVAQSVAQGVAQQGINTISATDSVTSSILIDTAHTRTVPAELLRKAALACVTHAGIAVGSHQYTRRRGVFQGSPLSATLCDVLYDDLLAQHFGSVDPSRTAVLRIADDFLLVTSDPETARRSQQLLAGGFQSHGAAVNGAKTEMNYTVTENGAVVRNSVPAVHFYGFTLSTSDLSVTKECGDYIVSKAHFRSPRQLQRRLFFLSGVRLAPHLLSVKVNSPKAVAHNIQHIVASVAQQLKVWLRSCGNLPKQRHAELITGFAERLVAQCIRKLRQVNGAQCPPARETTEIVYSAFRTAFRSACGPQKLPRHIRGVKDRKITL